MGFGFILIGTTHHIPVNYFYKAESPLMTQFTPTDAFKLWMNYKILLPLFTPRILCGGAWLL